MKTELPVSYAQWRDLPAVERVQVFNRIDPYGDPPAILSGLGQEFQAWGQKTEGVVDALVCNNHGSLELRVTWKQGVDLGAAPMTFLDIPVRNVPFVSPEEMQQLERKITAQPGHPFSQALLMGLTLVLIPLSAVAGLFRKKSPNQPPEPIPRPRDGSA